MHVANYLSVGWFHNLSAEQQVFPLYRRKALFLWKSPCGGSCGGDWGPTERTVVPREKKFPEEICFSPDKTESLPLGRKIVVSVSNPDAVASQKESVYDTHRYARLGRFC